MIPEQPTLHLVGLRNLELGEDLKGLPPVPPTSLWVGCLHSGCAAIKGAGFLVAVTDLPGKLEGTFMGLECVD